MRGQVRDTEVREKSLWVCLHACVFEWLQMHGGWLYHRACEKLDLAELCQPGGQKSVMCVRVSIATKPSAEKSEKNGLCGRNGEWEKRGRRIS